MSGTPSPARKPAWQETATAIACVSSPLLLSVLDLLTFRQAGVIADALGILGAVITIACELPALRARVNLRRTMVTVGAACMLYWLILYFIVFYYASSHLNTPESPVGVVRSSATPEL